MSFDNKWIEIDYWFNGHEGNVDDTKHQWGKQYPGWGKKKVGPNEELSKEQTLSPNNNPSGWEKTSGIFSMDLNGAEIRFKFWDTGIFSPFLPNGPTIKDVDKNLPPIVGVKLRTNMHGLERSDIRIRDEDTLQIDWNGGSFTKTTYVHIDVAFAQEVIGNRRGNVLKGGEAIDYITGGKGADRLTGGKDADVFIFRKGDSGKTKKSADLITDFSAKQGDRVDLHLWDADTATKGVQDFDFIGKQKFSREAGELRYQKHGAETLLAGDTDGDGKADFMIRFKGSIAFADDLFYF